ncbi:unnamed protein product [Sphagnum tenellum]
MDGGSKTTFHERTPTTLGWMVNVHRTAAAVWCYGCCSKKCIRDCDVGFVIDRHYTLRSRKMPAASKLDLCLMIGQRGVS